MVEEWFGSFDDCGLGGRWEVFGGWDRRHVVGDGGLVSDV